MSNNLTKIQVKSDKPKFTAYLYIDDRDICIKLSDKLPTKFKGKSFDWIKSYSRGRGFQLAYMN